MATSYSLHQGKKEFLSTDKSEIYNKVGSILFTTDTNELFINTGDISDPATAKKYRKQVNALYATALVEGDTKITPLDIRTIQEILGIVDGDTSTDNTTFNLKMDKVNPRGSGNIIITDDENKEFDIEENNKNNFLIGTNLQINTTTSNNNSNSIISGKFNVPLNNSLFVIGNGEDNQKRKNAFSIVQNGTKADCIISGNLYINDTSNGTDPLSDNLVITTTDLNVRLEKEREKTNTALEKLSVKPYTVSPNEPADKKLLWIDISSGNGNGILKYWDETNSTWKALSAVYA